MHTAQHMLMKTQRLPLNQTRRSGRYPSINPCRPHNWTIESPIAIDLSLWVWIWQSHVALVLSSRSWSALAIQLLHLSLYLLPFSKLAAPSNAHHPQTSTVTLISVLIFHFQRVHRWTCLPPMMYPLISTFHIWHRSFSCNSHSLFFYAASTSPGALLHLNVPCAKMPRIMKVS